MVFTKFITNRNGKKKKKKKTELVINTPVYLGLSTLDISKIGMNFCSFLPWILLFLQIAFVIAKWVYPYEYMDDWEKFNKLSLPKKEEFFSNLNMEYITYAD